MGLLLSVLFSYVGAIELVLIIRDIVHQIGLHQQRLDAINNDQANSELNRIQRNLRQSITYAKENRTCDSEDVQCMEDGVQYTDGYRVESQSAQDASKEWLNRRIELQKADELAKTESNVLNDDSTYQRLQYAGSGSGSDNSIQSSTGDDSVKTVIERKRSANLAEKYDDFDGLSQSGNSTDNLLTTSMTNSSDGYLNDASDTSDMPDMTFSEYSEGYLRSLDGIKSRPLSRDASTRRRRVFKSANSSESTDMQRRASREEELKMFTSLEEEEFEMIKHSDYAPIQYSSEPNLKAKHHVRRHKRSPVRRTTDETDETSSYRDSGNFDEVTDPWGEVRPEHFHNTELWERERAMSIVEDDRSHEEEEDTKKNVTNAKDAVLTNSIINDHVQQSSKKVEEVSKALKV